MDHFRQQLVDALSDGSKVILDFRRKVAAPAAIAFLCFHLSEHMQRIRLKYITAFDYDRLSAAMGDKSVVTSLIQGPDDPYGGKQLDPTEEGPHDTLWPNGPPTSFSQQHEKSEAFDLVVELDCPDDVSEEEIIRRVRELALRADAYHRELGGSGLKIDSLEIYEAAGAPTGVPNG